MYADQFALTSFRIFSELRRILLRIFTVNPRNSCKQLAAVDLQSSFAVRSTVLVGVSQISITKLLLQKCLSHSLNVQ